MYKLYTTVDITYPAYNSSLKLKWSEQNFFTVIQTLSLRVNISYESNPVLLHIKGDILGFNTPNIISVWRFDFSTSHSCAYEKHNDPVGLLKDDFELVPFISGLNESTIQTYDIFVPTGLNKNIVFSCREY